MLKHVHFFLMLLLSWLSLPGMAQEPLPPEQAFRVSVQAINARTLEVRWDIAPGYYMYRDKFSFAVEPGTLEQFVLPPGQVKEDENFGRVETYRDQLRVQLPISGATGNLVLRVGSQGCADIGICYPPQKQTLTVAVPGENVSASAAVGSTAPVNEAAATWQQRLLRPSVLLPTLLGLSGVLLAAVPLRVRRGLWFKGAGLILMFAGAMLLLFLNNEEAPATATHTLEVRFAPVRNVGELDAMLALAQADKRAVLLDFYADWCGPCREMDKLTFADATVKQALTSLTLLRVDVTTNTPEQQALLKRFGLQGPPGIIVFDAKGSERADLRLIGYRPPEALLAHLRPIL